MFYFWLGAMMQAGFYIVDAWKGPCEPSVFGSVGMFIWSTIKGVLWS